MKTPTFSKRILKWHTENHRPMPWLEEKDPYRIWVSEIILQQTRVKQGWAYYERFLVEFPSIESLANAKIDKVLKIWEGLGYYSRARNMHHAANTILSEHNGIFPDTYQDILSLKGIGEYTAAAISSFAYDLPYAVLDGNVKRVISRIFGIEGSLLEKENLKQLKTYAHESLVKASPGKYNQAIINFGAIQCTPKSPSCQQCIMRSGCYAFSQNKVQEIPFKIKKKPLRLRYFHYLVLQDDARIVIRQRTQKDIWSLLYDYPCVEVDDEAELSEKDCLAYINKTFSLKKRKITIDKRSGPYQQILSHQKIIATFYTIKGIKLSSLTIPTEMRSIRKMEIKDYAKPKIMDIYLKDRSVYLF